jgi:predicted ester cyclase
MGEREEANKDTVRRWAAAFRAYDFDTATSLVMPTWVMHSVGGHDIGPGPQALRQLGESLQRSRQEADYTIDDILAEGDRVALRVTNRIVHRGDWGPLPADGKTETFTVLFIHRVEDGKLAESWRVSDDLERAHQLGGTLVPTHR